ncbi:unnamed protein product [Adineta ricciae]|uniref:Uncharacterized protein n=2 Tax=Adineta ricciae TaxID=249248 RepID=A0A815HYE9_ADIRI|nr:unnamed protein product [Adineta ricciae]
MLIKDLFVWFREQIFTYNLFIPIEIDSENENEQIQQTNSNIKYQRYATRLYVPLFIIIFYIISLIMLVSPRSRLITISGMTPAKFNELRKNHGESLSCPCSSTTMIYKEFLSNSISFHPVCTSIFVTEQWIEGVYFENASAYLMMDFRSTASSQFALLSTLCKYCQKIINEVEIDLENEIFLTNDLYSEDEVQSQILKDVELIRLSTPIRSILSLLFLQTITQSNSFISALNTNAVVYIYYLQNRSIVSAGFTTYQNPKSPELSYLISTCQSINVTVPSGIYNVSYEQTADYRAFWPAFQPFFNPKPIVLINGFFSGCTPLDALLMSSLDCLFNQTCLDYLPIYFPKLNQINSSLINGLCHSKQEKISLKENLNNLLIEEWITNINYSIYFEKCSPLKCFYTETNRMNYSYAITFLFSLYGGLVIILRLISMVLIKILFQLKIYQVNLQFNRNIIMRNIHKIIQWMKQLNIFPSVQQKTPNDIKEQRLATKIYLLLLSGSFLILLLFTSLNSEMLTIYKMNPTLNEYKIFENLNLNSLQCPCTNMTISYSIFNSFNPILHDVCSSDFVGSDWISMMKLLETLPEGIQWYGINAQQIRLLANLCEKANKTIADATNRFNHRLLFTLNALNQILQDFLRINSKETNFLILLGKLTFIMGFYPKTIKYFEQLLIYQKDMETIRLIQFYLARSSHLQGDLKRARDLYDQIYDGLMHSNPINRKDTGEILNQIGHVLELQSNYDEALRFYEKSLETREETCSSDDPDIAISLISIANLYFKRQKYNEALEHFQRAVIIQEKLFPNHFNDLVKTLNLMGKVLLKQSKSSDALKTFQKALKIQEDFHSNDYPDKIETFENISLAYEKLKIPRMALVHYKKILAIEQKYLSTEHPQRIQTEKNIQRLSSLK